MAERLLSLRCQEQNTKEEEGIYRVSAGVSQKEHGVKLHAYYY